MATFVSDTFTDANGTLLSSHTGETGATWTLHASYGDRQRIQDNRAYVPASNSSCHASGSPVSAEYDVQCDVRCVSNAGRHGIAGRVATGANTMYLSDFTSGTGWRLFKV